MDTFDPGTHLLIDHRGGLHLADAALLEQALRGVAQAVDVAVLSAQFHALPDRAGLAGALILADGQISVLTWPEQGYAALDVFLPGPGRAQAAADALARALLPDWAKVTAVPRNRMAPPAPLPQP